MSAKGTYTTAEPLDWDEAISLMNRLFKDGNYRISLLVGCGIFFGLRISDLLRLTWHELIDEDTFIIHEKKTGKRRIIKVNDTFKRTIMYSGRYPFSVPVIPVHFWGVKTDYLLRS
jgi:integrase